MNDNKNQTTDDQTETLTLEDLNIEELEHRLELAATNAVCTCGKYA
jgi:hypothetical protein